MSCTEILAKPNQSLIEHTRECLKTLAEIKPQMDPLIEPVLKNLNVDKEAFWRHAFYGVAYHDYGKHAISFQERMLSIREIEKDTTLAESEREEAKKKVPPAFPHALVSTWPVFQIEVQDPLVSNFHITMASVGSHHSALTPGRYDIKGKGQPPLCDATDFLRVVEEQYPIYGGDVNTKIDPRQPPNYLSIFHKLRKIQHEPPEKLKQYRLLYATLKNIIHLCDWQASAKGDGRHLFVEDMDKKVNDYLYQLPDFKRKEAQEITSKAKGNLFLVSPTGSGKTEAALLWAANQGSRRLIFLLPTMATSNKMLLRLSHENLFGKDSVNLHHSAAAYLRSEPDSEYAHPEEYADLYAKTFHNPITVATIDQLLFHLYNYGRWDSVLFNSLMGSIVIDEVHAFDHFTTALIIETINELVPYDVPFLIMSATLPSTLVRFIRDNAKGDFRFDETHEDDCEKRLTVEVRESDYIETCLKEAERKLRDEGRSVLIIANTVAKATELYESLVHDHNLKPSTPEELGETLLFHSQFTNDDKTWKAKYLEEVGKRDSKRHPIIAVCTQVVEVSLDINFDFLYTEAAPIDALVQRFGRVNRKGEKRFSEAYIFKPDEKTEYIYNMKHVDETMKMLDRTPRPTEADFKNFVNSIYSGEDYLQKMTNELTHAREILKKVFDSVKGLYRLDVGEEFMNGLTRRNTYPTKASVPACFAEEVSRNMKLFHKYAINVPYWKNKNFFRKHEEKEFPIIGLKYDFEKGLELEPDVSWNII